MKKSIGIVLGLLVIAAGVGRAETAFPPHALSLGIGGVFPFAYLDTGPVGADDQRVGSNGGIVGARYMYASNQRIDIGLGVESWKTGEEEFTFGLATGEMDMKSTTFMALAKIHPVSINRFIPYFLGGVGIHVTEFNFDVNNRAIISDKQAGLALTVGAGVDFNISRNFFLAFESRLDLLSDEEYEATAYGQSLGIAHADPGAANGVLQLRLGYRFGGSDEPVTAEPPDQPKTTPAKTEGAL